MAKFSFLILLISSFSAQAAIDVSPIVAKIRSQSCASALNPNPLVIVVGLGNFGYEGTRHNLGDETLTHLERMFGVPSETLPEAWEKYVATSEADAEEYMEFTAASSPRRNGLTVEYRIGGRVALPTESSQLSNIIFVHPYYDINESGHFVAALSQQLNISADQIIVLVDDLSLPRNQVVLSSGKVDGTGDGHNGLKSINSGLGTGSYYRVRIGISNPKSEKVEMDRADWVLGQVPDVDRTILFSNQRLTELMNLITNIQARKAPGAHVQKMVGQASAILKRINSQN